MPPAEHPDVSVLSPFADADDGLRPEEFSLEQGALVGSQCRACGQASFPVAFVCFACLSGDLAPYLLPQHGALYTYTLVRVSPDRDVPYAIGYVDLPDGLRVLAPLDIPEAELRCDLAVHLVVADQGWSFAASANGGTR
jgi:uncharacterized OB-fold protein